MPDGTTIWRPSRPTTATESRPALRAALARGARGRCPCCGGPALFTGWLSVARSCGACGAATGALRADDAPPYAVIFIVGHLIVPALLLLERVHPLPLAIEAAIFLPLAGLLSLALLRPVKGALLGAMLATGAHEAPATT